MRFERIPLSVRMPSTTSRGSVPGATRSAIPHSESPCTTTTLRVVTGMRATCAQRLRDPEAQGHEERRNRGGARQATAPGEPDIVRFGRAGH